MHVHIILIDLIFLQIYVHIEKNKKKTNVIFIQFHFLEGLMIIVVYFTPKYKYYIYVLYRLYLSRHLIA